MKTTHRVALIGGILLSCCALILYISSFLSPRWKIVDKNADALLDRAFSFGTPAGLYEENVTLRLETNVRALADAEIRYTLDGTEPTEGSALYEEPIVLPAPEGGLTAYPVKAKVFADGELVGGTYNSTYFLTSDASAFRDVLLVSITSDPDGLFSKERGILYPAKTLGGTSDDFSFEDFMALNCCQSGPEWIRDAHVDIFEGNGQRVISQYCGLSTSGYYGSFTHYPFSLCIRADDAYQPEMFRFYYDFFGEKSDVNATPYYYNKIYFKNGGNDFNYMGARDDVFGCMLRNVVCSELAEECGFLVSKQRMAVVYLNGDFYNVAFTMAGTGRKTISAMTGLPDDQIVVQKMGEELCMGELRLKSSYCSFPDLEASEIFQKYYRFDNLINMKDLFRYYAFECMIGNTEWPKQNYCLWRYNGDKIKGNPWATNQYRPYIFDLDCAYHHHGPTAEPWDYLWKEPSKSSSLLITLLQIDKYREMFLNEWLDMLHSETFSEEHILSLIDEKNAMCAPWFHWMYGDEAENVRQENVLLFKNYVHEHRQHIIDEMKEQFGVDAYIE